jgi:outer membrane protein insertion porin family
MLRRLGVLAALFVAPLAASPAAAQTPAAPAPYEILAVTVDGAADEASQALVRSLSGLRTGLAVQLPWDPRFGEAVRNLYTRGGYSNAEVIVDEIAGNGVFLTIRVAEDARLAGFEIEGLGAGDREDVRERIPLLRGRAVRPADVERGRVAIETFLREKGYRTATVTHTQATGDDGRVTVTYAVDRGDRARVATVEFLGNEAFSDRTLAGRMKNTRARQWWRFWSRSTFDDAKYREDLAAVESFYRDRGYYGARVVSDSVFVRPAADGASGRDLVVQVTVEEGPRYHIRNVVFEGNTIYTDEQLQTALGIAPGDVYNASLIERNLYYTPEHTDIASLYNDRGHLRFDVERSETLAPGDSLDLAFEITEGPVYEFGSVDIAGNTRTKEHVIRRELRTIPGQPYSRQAVERTVRELAQLNYFDPASFSGGPTMDIDEATQRVNLTYRLAETSSDQLELSGGWGGSAVGGLILSARVTFSNFSVQNLIERRGGLPAGDGQQLALQVQTYGTRQQVYSLSFTEPWFRGRQTPAGFALAYSNLRYDDETRIGRASGSVFYRQRLRWPDDFFLAGTNLQMQVYNITGITGTFRGLPSGVSRELTLTQSFSRNATDNPMLPQAGSNVGLAVTVAPPIPGFIQYHKWELDNDWYTPIGPRLSANVQTRFGYIGSLTGEDVLFQRYLVGGTAMEASSGVANGFGKDLVFLRGYPLEAIGPRRDGEAVGGRILNRYTAEIQWLALQSPQLTLAPYLFADAANTWDSFADYDPSRLYRSAGVGTRVFLPILGLVDLSYAYRIDAFDTSGRGGDDGRPGWHFQLSLGGR